jgi:diguanylate cyclase (GGDEF)-like protein/hemerythrin-like metal-binding protein/PAS domain S-box-containing protein
MSNKEPTEVLPLGSANFIQNLVLLMHGSSAMIGLKDLEFRYVFANRELEVIFGAAPGMLVGTTVRDWVDPDDANDMQARDAAVVQSGQTTHFIERFFIGGEPFTCATIRFPYRDQTGLIIGTGVLVLDIRGRDEETADMHRALGNAQQTIGELQKAVDEMRLRATTDLLTGAWNRSQIEESAKREIARLDRYWHPVSIVFADLDHFKRVNDTLGHATGDDVLKDFCDVMRSCLRTTDLLGRWGGEEFLLLLPNTGSMSACLVAERARQALAQHTFQNVGQVTASFGVATCRPGETLVQWIARADTALYRAKMNGRNCVETDVGGSDAADVSEVITPSFVGLIWRKAYECGQPLIDRQHRSLFESGNQLLTAVLGGQPKDEITHLINASLVEVVQHFEDEEAIFSAAGFPESDQHREIHQQLVAKALRFARRYEDDKLDVGELFTFLAHEVVAKHMLSDDRKFFPYVASSS